MANRIHAKGPYVHEENVANSALIYPGFLIERDANDEVAPHDVFGGVTEAMFAEEDALQGRGISTIYDDDSIVSSILPGKGSCIRAMIKDGEDISIGDALISNGDGTLVSTTLEESGDLITQHIIAFACEALDLTGSAPDNGLCEVRIL